MKNEKTPNIFSRGCYKVVWFFVKLFYPKIKVVGAENLPKSACIVAGNHTQMNGPICAELYFPGKRTTWCAEQMMFLKEVPAYAYKDFWSNKPKYIRWFFKIVSYIIAPLSVCIFNNAHTIPVFRDTRIISTFRKTVSALSNGENVIIFPECYEPYNNIVNNFQTRFTDVAKLYYKKTKEAVSFVPLYIAPTLKTMYIGKPVEFNPLANMDEERDRICKYLMDEITNIAKSLPKHTVVPYANIPKKEYKTNV